MISLHCLQNKCALRSLAGRAIQPHSYLQVLISFHKYSIHHFPPHITLPNRPSCLCYWLCIHQKGPPPPSVSFKQAFLCSSDPSLPKSIFPSVFPWLHIPIPIINALLLVYPRYLFMWLSSLLTSECLASEMKVLVTSYSLCLASVCYVILCWVNIGIWVTLQSYTWTLSLQGRSYFVFVFLFRFFKSFQKRWGNNVNNGLGSAEIVPLHYAMIVESLK